MATLTNNSAAQELALERFRLAVELATRDESPYPTGAAFVAADRPELAVWLAEYAREHRPVVMVYPDGEERVLLPHPAAGPRQASLRDRFAGVRQRFGRSSRSS